MKIVLMILGIGAVGVGVYFIVRSRVTAERAAAFVQRTRVARAEATSVSSRARAEALGSKATMLPRLPGTADSGGSSPAGTSIDRIGAEGEAPIGI